MKQLIILMVCICCGKAMIAQQQNNTAGKSNTYALIIGVAQYLDPEVPQLQFANRDAQIFADFLKSKEGGLVPKQNIRLLIDSAATTGAVYDAVYWLKNICKKDDVVYFYFSGHGDLENITMYNNGFLICYDSPPFNYVKLALSIDYINDIANTISSQKQANVILITDACHSGKLNEKRFKGNFLAGNQLRKLKNKEIRITSSSSNQLSNEKTDWGEGRGVFSYYLVNGLKGMANPNSDKVTLEDIRVYLDSSLKNDLVLKKDSIIQTPVVSGGTGNFVLSYIDTNALIAANREVTQDRMLQRALMVSNTAPEDDLSASPEEYFFGLLKQKSLEALTDTFRLNEIAKELLTYRLIEVFKKDLSGEGENKLTDLEQTLKSDKETLKLFNNRLASLFDEVGQRVITQYLKGDAAELEKRRYYNANNNGYDVYVRMFEVALKLVTTDNDYYQNLIRVKLHYFTGVAARLKIPITAKEKQKALIDKAFAAQKKALAIEEHAPYVYNELGILYSYKKMYKNAETNFRIAAARAPNWAIPLVNLSDLFAADNKPDSAMYYADSAKVLQPGFQDLYLGYGIIHEKKGNLLQAEEQFQKSIKLNDRHFIPFERLGYVYMNNTAFAKADSMFFEAAERKKGFNLNPEMGNLRNMKIPKNPLFVILCTIDSNDTGSRDIIGQFAMGYTAYRDNDLAKAERAFKRVIALDNKNPLAFHYLGKTLAEQNRFQEAELVLKLAIDNHLPYTLFTKYYDSLFTKSSVSTEFIVSPCSDSCYRLGYYNKEEDYLLLAQVYENRNHYSESEIYYRKLIAANPNNAEGYLKLVDLFEKSGRYNDAENYLLEYNIRSNYSIDRELNAFYKRTANQFPENADWNLKAGNFQYTMARIEPDGFWEDIKWINPVTRETEYKYYQTVEQKLPPPVKYRLLPYGTVKPRSNNNPAKYKPYTDGIYYLRKAAMLINDDETVLAGVNSKLGDLYYWQGLSDSAVYFYEAAVELNPTDAGTRNKLIETYTLAYRFANALAQLDSLYKKDELSFDKQLLLATLYMQDGRFEDAGKLLNDAEQIAPVLNPVLISLQAKLAMLNNKPKQALEYYNRLYLVNKTDSINLYCMARLEAKNGNKAEAWKWLELALQAGFNYKYVIEFDPALKNLLKDAKWKKMFSGIKGKAYFSPDQLIN